MTKRATTTVFLDILTDIDQLEGDIHSFRQQNRKNRPEIGFFYTSGLAYPMVNQSFNLA